jgi:TP901 family phage tail tape measure protein
MTNRVVSVAIKAEIGSYVAGLSRAGAATRQLGDDVTRTQTQASRGFDLAGKGALLMGGSIVAGLGMAVAKSMEFEKSMSAVQAATQAGGAELDNLRAAAMQAGAETAYSATEAANAITEMAKAGVSTADIMGGGLTGALSLAAAGQIDVAEAAGIASTAMTQFNLTGEDLPHVADLLAAGAGKAMGSVDDLGQALNQAGLVASAAGMNIEETTGALAAFASAGLVGSDAGTSLKSMMLALQGPSGKASETMAGLGLNLYDTNGHMLGMADIAGQLQTHLGGLTDEQRNAAMATIFGSDAVRAANVLYKEGAAGIEEWTNKVNDAGYASDQARALQDNLAGDLEKLGGAFDTFLINLGSGAQGPLREVVQMLTGLVDVTSGAVDVFGAIPGPVAEGAAALGAWLLLRGPLDAMFTRLAVGLTSTVTGMGMAAGATTGFGVAAGTARVAVAGLVSAAAPLAVAIAAAYAVKEVVDFVKAGDDATEQVKDLNKAIRDADSNDARFGTISAGLDDLKRKAADAQAKIKEIDDQSYLHKVFISPFTGDGGELKDAQEGLVAYREEIARVEAAQDRQTQSVDVLAKHYGISKDDVIAFADAHGINLAGSLQIAQGDFLRLAGASIASGDAMVNGRTQAEDFQTGLEAIAAGASDATTQIGLYKASLDVLNGDHITAIQAESDFYAAIQAANGALDNMGGTVLNTAGGLNVQSEAGRKTQDVLLGVKDSADQYIATLIEQGATADVANAKDAELRDAFYQTALQMTGNADAAGRLTDELYGIPEERRTTITADTKQATDAAAAVQAVLDNMRNRVLTVTVQTRQINAGGWAAGAPTYQDTYKNAAGQNVQGTAYQAMGGIVHAYAAGGFESMQAGVAQIVQPNTWRVIGDRVTDDEAYIPINGAARSHSILEQTAERMGYGLSREASGPTWSSREFGGGAVSLAAPNVSVAAPNVTVLLDGQELRATARIEAQGVVVEAVTGMKRTLNARGVRA